MGPNLNGPFRKVVGFTELEYRYNGIVGGIVWDPNNAIDIAE